MQPFAAGLDKVRGRSGHVSHLGHLPQSVKGMMVCVVDPPDVWIGYHYMRQELQVHESARQALWQLHDIEPLCCNGLHRRRGLICLVNCSQRIQAKWVLSAFSA